MPQFLAFVDAARGAGAHMQQHADAAQRSVRVIHGRVVAPAGRRVADRGCRRTGWPTGFLRQPAGQPYGLTGFPDLERAFDIHLEP